MGLNMKFMFILITQNQLGLPEKRNASVVNRNVLASVPPSPNSGIYALKKSIYMCPMLASSV